MKVFTNEFWNTPIGQMDTRDKAKSIMLLFSLLVLGCVALGGVAAWQLIYGG